MTDGPPPSASRASPSTWAHRCLATEERVSSLRRRRAGPRAAHTQHVVTAASQADAAVVLVDATKLDWQNPQLALLPQTRRHSLLVRLRVHSAGVCREQSTR